MSFGAGRLLTAQYLNDSFPATKDDSQITSGTTLGTSYSPTLTGGTAAGTTFQVPLSGKVTVTNTAQCQNNGTGTSLCAFEIRTGAVVGSGTVLVAASDDVYVGCIGSASGHRSSSVDIALGLPAGTICNIRQTFRVTSNTGTFARKKIEVNPEQ